MSAAGDRQEHPEELGVEESLGPLMRRLFDAEREDLPPFFSDALFRAADARRETSWYDEMEVRVLQRFFSRIGRDYDAWRRQRRRGRLLALALVVVLLAILGGLLFTQPQALEAVRRPFIRRYNALPTPAVTPEVTHYRSVTEVQPYFPVHLPPQPPVGFRLVNAVVERGWPAGPRGALFYQSGDPSDPDQGGAVVSLFFSAMLDDPFQFPTGVRLESINLDGLPAYWIAGTPGSQWTVWRQDQGGWVLWEREGWKFALVAADLRREELLKIAGQLARQ